MRLLPGKDKNDLGPRTKAATAMVETAICSRIDWKQRAESGASKAEEVPAYEIAERRSHQRKQRRRGLAEQRGIYLLGRSAGFGIAEIFRHKLTTG